MTKELFNYSNTEFIGTTREDITCVKKNGKWNFIDYNDYVLCKDWFKDETCFVNDYARVQRDDGSWNFINKNGNYMLTDWIYDINELLAIESVYRNNKETNKSASKETAFESTLKETTLESKKQDIRLQVAISSVQNVLRVRGLMNGEIVPEVVVKDSLRIADEFVKQYFESLQKDS